ncbi:PLD-like domain-containing protein [Tistlia consotensis]|uniref:Phospholipase D n=1 Tax=Tistlia consotensis USBA 355 TaxID=560819 RepID=A0A1Y6C027_9PROT|nr:PLD-like domain-containing protein [Tistlia consotensis USBA 355]SNR36994.1 PLD-like domain-containing protein [Tistlia consotensis]
MPAVAGWLEAALARCVEVVLLVPAEPEGAVARWRRGDSEEGRALFAALAALGRFPTFTLAGLAARDAAGRRRAVYVHAKAMLVDDAWLTLGSCNLHRRSLSGHSELNAAVWDPAVARGLRVALFAEHLGRDTAGLDDRAALRLFAGTARRNRDRLRAGEADWPGLAVALDPDRYGETPVF